MTNIHKENVLREPQCRLYLFPRTKNYANLGLLYLPVLRQNSHFGMPQLPMGTPQQSISFSISFQNVVILGPLGAFWPPGLLLCGNQPLYFCFKLLLKACRYLTPWSLCALLALWLPTVGHTANKDFWLAWASLHFGASLHREQFRSVANPHLWPSKRLNPWLSATSSFQYPPCLECFIASKDLSHSSKALLGFLKLLTPLLWLILALELLLVSSTLCTVLNSFFWLLLLVQ